MALAPGQQLGCAGVGGREGQPSKVSGESAQKDGDMCEFVGVDAQDAVLVRWHECLPSRRACARPGRPSDGTLRVLRQGPFGSRRSQRSRKWWRIAGPTDQRVGRSMPPVVGRVRSFARHANQARVECAFRHQAHHGGRSVVGVARAADRGRNSAAASSPKNATVMY